MLVNNVFPVGSDYNNQAKLFEVTILYLWNLMCISFDP